VCWERVALWLIAKPHLASLLTYLLSYLLTRAYDSNPVWHDGGLQNTNVVDFLPSLLTYWRIYVSSIIWLVIVLGACSFFIWFMTDRVMYLASYPKAVDVEVIYTDSVLFPAVTICNQNLFRFVFFLILNYRLLIHMQGYIYVHYRCEL